MTDSITRYSDKEKLITHPTFIISVDVELAWGFIENKQNSSFLIKDDMAGRGIIQYLLNIFEKYNMAATWAVVGHLFLDHCDACMHACEDSIPHKDMPRYKYNWYSRELGTNIRKDPLYYGTDIIENIISSPIEHEIAYHSFSHCNFSECSREVAKAEIKQGLKLAKKFGIKLQSFVFPYDKKGHLNVLRNYGFKIYRSKGSRFWDVDQRRTSQKISGTLDQMVPPPPVLPRWTEGLWEIPTSMVFSGQTILTNILALRAKLGINRTIRSNKVFHISLHPWNLLNSSIAQEFEKILPFVCEKRDKGNLQLATMGELASYLNKKRHRSS